MIVGNERLCTILISFVHRREIRDNSVTIKRFFLKNDEASNCLSKLLSRFSIISLFPSRNKTQKQSRILWMKGKLQQEDGKDSEKFIRVLTLQQFKSPYEFNSNSEFKKIKLLRNELHEKVFIVSLVISRA